MLTIEVFPGTNKETRHLWFARAVVDGTVIFVGPALSTRQLALNDVSNWIVEKMNAGEL